MRVAFVADVHVGNHRRFGGPAWRSMNVRCRLAVDVFTRAVERVVDLECDALVVLGDLLDSDRPEPQIITAIHDALRVAHEAGVQVFLLVGNHDQTSNVPGDNALHALAPFARIVDSPEVIRLDKPRWPLAGKTGPAAARVRDRVDIFCVPFSPEPAEGWLRLSIPGMVASLGEEAGGGPDGVPPRLLAVHMGVRDASTAKWLSGARDAIDIDPLLDLCRIHGIQRVFAGNWHDRRRWEFFMTEGCPVEGAGEVFQLGALVPTGFDNPGLTGYGTLAVWDSHHPASGRAPEVEAEELPGPRFIVHSDDDLTHILDANKPLGNKLFVSWTVGSDELVGCTEVLSTLREQGLVIDGEVLADQGEIEAAARTAAHAARSARGLDDALDAFVAHMRLDEGVDRAAVLARARGYLVKGEA